MPAFGPPSWTVIVVYGLNTKMPFVALVITAGIAAALGRYLLAHASRLLRRHVPPRIQRNLEAAGQALQGRKRHSILALGLFALSPLPSAQLFEAAGLTGLRLLPFTCAFFVGRLASYSVYGLTAKSIEATSIGAAFRNSLMSPIGIVVQTAMLALLVALTQIDWARHFGSDAGKKK